MYNTLYFIKLHKEGHFVNNSLFISLFRLAIRYFYILVISALVFAFSAFSFCEFIAEPIYSATGSVLVTNGTIIKNNNSDNTQTSSRVEGTDITASLNLVNTITDILKTNDIYKDLAAEFNNKYTYEQLKQRSTIKQRSNQTLFVDIAFTAHTKEEAISLVNSYVKLVPDYISKYIPNSSSSVTTSADTANKTYPRTFLTTFAAAIFGAGLAFAVIFIVNSFNTTIKNESDLTENYDLLIIGNIPDFEIAQSKSYSKSNKYLNYSNEYKYGANADLSKSKKGEK